MSNMKNRGYKLNIYEDRFIELDMNPQNDKFDEKLIFQTEGGL